MKRSSKKFFFLFLLCPYLSFGLVYHEGSDLSNLSDPPEIGVLDEGPNTISGFLNFLLFDAYQFPAGPDARLDSSDSVTFTIPEGIEIISARLRLMNFQSEAGFGTVRGNIFPTIPSQDELIKGDTSTLLFLEDDGVTGPASLRLTVNVFSEIVEENPNFVTRDADVMTDWEVTITTVAVPEPMSSGLWIGFFGSSLVLYGAVRRKRS